MSEKNNGLNRETVRTDVLIVGAGAAGLRAAIACAEAEVDCVLAAKGRVGAGGGTFSAHNRVWGIQAALALADPSDSPEKHFQEIMDVSLGMCNVELASTLVNEAPARVRELEEYGVKFQMVDGRYAQITGCFCNIPRALQVTDVGTARRALLAKIDVPPVRKIDHLQIVRLLTDPGSGRCVGAVGYAPDHTLVTVLARATILATGGGGSIFRNNLVGKGATGDGYQLGFEAGAELINLEFIQVMLGIPGFERDAFLPIDLFDRKPRFLNSRGEPFLTERFPTDEEYAAACALRKRHYPFSCRDDAGVIDAAIAKQILRGKCSRQFAIQVEYDGVKEDYPDGLQVAPFAHAFNGGLQIDTDGATTVDALYAAGESAGGIHGADRPGGNMFAAAFVFGARAGKAAAARAKSEKRSAPSFDPNVAEQIDRTAAQVQAARGKDSVAVEAIRRHVTWLLWKKGLIIRNEGTLSSALGSLLDQSEQLDALEEVIESDVDPIALTRGVLELQSIIGTGRLVLRAAINRRESRGSHYREDYPMKDDEKFGRPIPLSKEILEAEPKPA